MESFELLIMGRRLVHKGYLGCKKLKSDFAILCNDILVLCRTVERDEQDFYLLLRTLELDKLTIVTSTNDPIGAVIQMYDSSRQHSWEFEVHSLLSLSLSLSLSLLVCLCT
jgi:hypothetical protein